MYLCIKFMFVCCLKLRSWNAKKEELFHKKIYPTLTCPSHWQRALSSSYKYVPLCFIVLLTNAVSLLHSSRDKWKSLQWNKHEAEDIYFIFNFVWMRGWWNQCCLLAVCKLGMGVKRPKHGCLFLGILNCTIVKWLIYWVQVLKQGC